MSIFLCFFYTWMSYQGACSNATWELWMRMYKWPPSWGISLNEQTWIRWPCYTNILFKNAVFRRNTYGYTWTCKTLSYNGCRWRKRMPLFSDAIWEFSSGPLLNHSTVIKLRKKRLSAISNMLTESALLTSNVHCHLRVQGGNQGRWNVLH